MEYDEMRSVCKR